MKIKPVNLLFLFGIRRSCLRSGRSRTLYLSIMGVTKQIVVIIEVYNFFQLRTKFCPTSCCQRILLGIMNVDFDATGQLLITYYAFVKYLRKNGNARKKCVSSL